LGIVALYIQSLSIIRSNISDVIDYCVTAADNLKALGTISVLLYEDRNMVENGRRLR